MYISPDEYSRVYREIKRTSLSHSTCKLIIFVACLNIDALCAAKILSVVLRKELVQYQLVPVVGYTDLKQHFDKLDDDVTNVVLVGCGAMLDLEGFLDIDPDAYVISDSTTTTTNPNDDWDSRPEKFRLRRKIYVIDGNRPWNLDNLFGSHMVVCLDDGHVDRRLTKERSAYMTLQELDDDEDEDNDEEYDDTDNDEDEDGDVVHLSADEDEDDYQSLSEDDEETKSRKRGRRKQITDKNLKRQRKRQLSQSNSVLEDYYSQGTLVITSATATIYALLAAIGETNLENLWLAIVGTSSLDYHYPEIYDKIQPLYKDEVLRLNPPQLDGISQEKTADTSSLSIENDYHLFLLRHWTLYDAFFYSSFVNSKLNLWTEDGKKKLHKLFAKMGISLAIAQQKWLYMDILVKKQLPIIFNKYLPMYGLEGIVRDGFVRTYGFKGQLTAMECVESLTALLELDASLLNSDIFQSLESSRNLLRASQSYQSRAVQPDGDNVDAEGEEERIRLEIERKGKIWVNNFWSSWDAISDINSNLAIGTNSKANTKKKGYNLLLQGLEVAKNIQKIIFRTGMSVLERKLIKNLKLYRLCVLTEGSVPDLNIFVNPLMLSKLGTWLLENITELDFVNNNTSLKPLVVASFDVVTDTYLVIGLAPKYPRGMNNSEIAKLLQKEKGDQDKESSDPSIITRLNTFSVAFTQVANTSGAKVKIDGFDSSVIEIRKDDLSPFLEKLTLSGLI